MSSSGSSKKRAADMEKEGDVRVVLTVVGNGIGSKEEKASQRFEAWRNESCFVCPWTIQKHFLQSFEIMAIVAVGNNLITYLINEMQSGLSNSANIVTNFVGTIFLLALVGGYLSDSFLGSFWTILIFGYLELSGFILLSVQAHLPQLKPPKCDMSSAKSQGTCVEARGLKAVIFFAALHLVALGSGCVEPNMISHGADQFDREANAERLSSYFNAAYLVFSIGELVALTLLVWVQTHSGMDAGFGVSAAPMATGLIYLVCGTLYYRNKRPKGSIVTPIAQVFMAAAMKRKQPLPSNPDHLHKGHPATVAGALPRSHMFRLLEKACIRAQVDAKSEESPWSLCSVPQVEQTKMLLSVLPIFACTIVFNTILAQLQTFSVQQGSAMDTRIAPSFRIPQASLQAIPYAMLVFLVPLYDAFLVPFARRLTGHESGISPLRGIGFGLFLATFSMVLPALVERKRRDAVIGSGRILSILWITPQYLIFGVSEMFTAVGLIKFFYKQSLRGLQKMQSFLTAVTYCSYSFRFYISSLLVSLVNRITGGSSSGVGWLSDNDLNRDRLDLFYWLLAVLSFLNFLNYMFWARWVSRHHDNDAANSKPSANSSNHDRIAAAPPSCVVVRREGSMPAI